MLVAASTAGSPSTGTLVAIACFCAICFAFGIAHYRGWHRGWIRVLPFDANFFTPAWFGAFGLLLTLWTLAHKLSALVAVIVALPMFIAFVIGLMSLVWLPERLLPAWYRRWRAQGRPPGGLTG